MITSYNVFENVPCRTFMFQPCFSGTSSSPEYLVYVSPEGETSGKFVQEEGGLVWFSENFPLGEICETFCIPKPLGDEILKNIEMQNKKGAERST